MKKLIAATAGLMLVGTVASAMAADAPGVTFGGNARVRYFYQDNYVGASKLAPTDTERSFWTSRVRLQFKAVAKGGAYAVGRFRLADSTWDGGQTTQKYGEGSNLRTDIAYIGVPMGPVTVEGGTGYNTMSTFFRVDGTYDFLRAKYATDTTTIVGFMEKLDEFVEVTTSSIDPKTGLAVSKTVIDSGYTSDDDKDQYGINLIQKLNGGWVLNAMAVLFDDQQTDGDGVGADVKVTGKVGGMDMIAEVAFKEADLQGTEDDGIGAYVGMKIPFGNVSLAAVAGMTMDGFVASGDFGDDDGGYAPFIMLSADTAGITGMMNTGLLVGSAVGDAMFVNVAPTVKISDKLSLTGEFTFMNADVAKTDLNIMEVGAMASYKVSDGATFTALAGYLDVEDADENPLAFGVALDIAY